jgi:hypothetical protein
MCREGYVPGEYKKERRRMFYQCRAHWFQKVQGRLILFAQERELILVGEVWGSPDNPRLQIDGRSLLIRELRAAIRRQSLYLSETKELIDVGDEYVSAAAGREYLMRTGGSRE